MDTDILVVNQCSVDKIDGLYRPVIEEATTAYQQIFGDALLNVRLLGSVARGEANPHSDIDFAALLKAPPTDGQHHETEDKAKEMGRKYPFISKVDLEAMPAEDLPEFRRFVFALDSLSLFGQDDFTLQSQILDRQKLVQMITPDANDIVESYTRAIEKIDENDGLAIAVYSRVTGKDLLRCLRGVVLLQGAEYERSIARIYRQLSLSMPERQDYLAVLCDLYTNPSTDKQQVLKALRNY